MAQTQEGSVEASKAWDNFRTGTGAMWDTLGNKNPKSTVQLFREIPLAKNACQASEEGLSTSFLSLANPASRNKLAKKPGGGSKGGGQATRTH